MNDELNEFEEALLKSMSPGAQEAFISASEFTDGNLAQISAILLEAACSAAVANGGNIGDLMTGAVVIWLSLSDGLPPENRSLN